MNNPIKSITAGALALSITAGSAFSQENDTSIRENINPALNSAALCSIDNGEEQVFIPVRSLRQCYDATFQSARQSARYDHGFTRTSVGTAYDAHDRKVENFKCYKIYSGDIMEVFCEIP